MNTRMLGRTGPRVSAVGMVCPQVWPPEDDVAIVAIRQALEAGISLFDAGPATSTRRQEALLRRALARQADHATVASRLNLRSVESPSALVNAADAVLSALGPRPLDLLILERLDDALMHIEEVAAAAEVLLSTGRIAHLALGDAHPALVRRMNNMVPVAAVQADYSLWSREAEAGLTVVAEQLGIGLLPWSPVGQGYLTPRLRMDSASDDAELGPETLNAIATESIRINRRFWSDIGRVGTRHDATVAQIACAWLMAKSPRAVPLLAIDDELTLAQVIAAADLTLSADDMLALDAALGVALDDVRPVAATPVLPGRACWLRPKPDHRGRSLPY